MQKHEFHDLKSLRNIATNRLATASAHNVYIDVGDDYNPDRSKNAQPRDPILARAEKDDGGALQGIWNRRDDKYEYVGSDRYQITQHFEVIDKLMGAVDDTTGEIDMGMIRDHGSQIDGLVTLDGHTIDVEEVVGEGYVPPEGELDPYGEESRFRDRLGVGVRFSNSFDGTKKINAETMGYRFICQNWLVWGESVIGTKEQLHVEELTEEFFEDLIFEVMDEEEAVRNVLIDSNEELIELGKVPPLLERAGFGKNYQKRITEVVMDQETPEAGWVPRWNLYNAVTYVLDHFTVEERDVNPAVYNRHQRKAQRILTGDIPEPNETIEIEEFIEA